MQRGADENRGFGVPIEQHVFPGDQDVVEDNQGIDFVESVGQRIIIERGAA